MALYRDPQFLAGYIFEAIRLSGIKELEKVLKPGQWNDRRNGQFQPQIGFTRNIPKANLSSVGHRILNRSLQETAASKGHSNDSWRPDQNYNQYQQNYHQYELQPLSHQLPYHSNQYQQYNNAPHYQPYATNNQPYNYYQHHNYNNRQRGGNGNSNNSNNSNSYNSHYQNNRGRGNKDRSWHRRSN